MRHFLCVGKQAWPEPRQGLTTLNRVLYLIVMVCFLSPLTGSVPLTGSGIVCAEEMRQRGVSYRAGVLELDGSTSISVNYQNESGGVRESTQLRITPSIGYFILDGFEVLFQVSYVFNILHSEVQNETLTDDRSHTFLFAIGPAYNFYHFSDIFVPYAGILVGTYYQHIRTSLPGVELSRSDLQMALGMDAGMRWMLTENLAIRAGFQYIHGFRAGEVGSTNFLGFEIGISVFIPTWPAYSKASNP